MKSQFRVSCLYMRLYTIRDPLTELSLSILNFHLISVQFLLNYISISIQMIWNWMEIEQDRK